MAERVHIFGMDLTLTPPSELFAKIQAGEKMRIATLNPEFMLEARRNTAFKGALQNMTDCTIDGTGLLWFLKTFRKRLGIQGPLELQHGSDLMHALFELYQNGEKSFYLLGGWGEKPEEAAEELRSLFPKINIVGAEDAGMIDVMDPVKPGVLERVNQAKPDILFVGVSAPKQELWIARADKELNAQVAVGIGASLGFYTTKKRAPETLRTLHLEWLWRSLTEKGHAKRAYRAVVVFSIVAVLTGLFARRHRT
jgi:N-acetylglucosaminyldiphosphoundecaprenol N-acetyl-beta-D-mannosaminyltransferase